MTGKSFFQIESPPLPVEQRFSAASGGGGDFDPQGTRGNVCKHPWGEQRKLPASNAWRSGMLLPRLPHKESPTTENYPANNVSSSPVSGA